MKKTFLFVFILYLSNTNLFAQHRGDNWCFGDSVMLNFAGGNIIVSTSAIHNTDFSPAHGVLEPAASISDSSGNLLFYTNGFTVWNRNHEVMLNGDSLKCSYTVTNGVIILPYPQHDSLYYIFYQNEFTSLYYSVVNINLDGGLGAIIQLRKNIPLISGNNLSEKLGAVKHGDGRDWWVIGHDAQYNGFFKFLITPDTIIGAIWQNIGLEQSYLREGEITFTRSGDKIGLVNPIGAQILDFDRCSGLISNNIILDSVPSTGTFLNYYGCEFSPDNTKFYVANEKYLYQFDLNNVNPPSTKTLLWNNPNYPSTTASCFAMGQLELAPDNKIYFTINSCAPASSGNIYSFQNMNLSVINFPDSLGLACNLLIDTINLNGHKTVYGLPNMPNYNLGKLVGSACDTLTSIQNENLKTKSSVRIFPNPATEQLTIDNGQFTITEIEITDMMGRIIYKEQSHSHLSIIHCQLFSAGIYFVKVYMNDGSVEVRKFVKEQQ
ncbi:MAG: T9SS C-terminal target domain-containing protein [Sphingobacteriales bacterium]|nr:MAG: T9SS C-terminal target domain-containing protein [Sphingobacteriales bacterium]